MFDESMLYDPCGALMHEMKCLRRVCSNSGPMNWVKVSIMIHQVKLVFTHDNSIPMMFYSCSMFNEP